MHAKRTRSPFELANLADCASPDALDSPGASFLLRVADCLADLPAGLGDNDRHDWTHETADSLVPVYTHELWQVFTDLAAYSEDLDDLGGSSGDMTKDASVSLYLIAERLLSALTDEADTDPTP